MTSIEAIVNRQFLKWELEKTEAKQTVEARPRPAPIVTISRQTGSRGSYFGSRLAQRLGYQRLHQEAIDLICKSSGYRRRIIESLDGKVRSRLSLLAESILTGGPVDRTDYAQHLCRVVLTMSELGGVVLIGRGGNFILGPHRGFHLRVICPRDRRIENLIKYKQLDATEAAATIDRSDADRQEYIATLFGANIDDPHQYDMAINSSLMDVEDMVNMTMVAIQAKMSKLTYLDHDQA